MFIGSMILAYAMEHVRLHRRLALLVLRFVGSSIIWYVLFFFLRSNELFSVLNRSMAGLMGVTAFLSMWINNSAATNIMIPTAIAIVNELQNNHRTDVTNKNDNHKNTIDSASIDFTSKEQFYSNI